MSTLTVYRREIKGLHDFFVEWYCGECDRDAFETVEQALAPAFERIAPDGGIDDRMVVLDGIRDSYDEYESGTFDIDIRNVELIETTDDRTLVRYEEWQSSPTGTDGRISTAYFASNGNGDRTDVKWRFLHETWIEPPE